jgi:peroxiredoxin
VIQLGAIIPPVSARTAEGKIIRAWDYKQKRNLVIAFLHADCARCAGWLTQLAQRAADFPEHEAVVLAVYAEAPPRILEMHAAPLIAATDAAGHSQRAFLGREVFGPAGLDRVGVFVADRYGELCAQWIASDATGLPSTAEILSTLWQIQVAC